MVNPQNFVVSEESQTYIIIRFHVYEKSSKGNTIETERGLVVSGAGVETQSDYKMVMEDLFGVTEVFQNWILVMVAQFCKYAKK